MLCGTAVTWDVNVNTDCLRDGNYGETSIGVHPTRPTDIVGAVIHTAACTVDGQALDHSTPLVVAYG